MKKTVKRTALFAASSLFALALTSGSAVAEMSEKEMFAELKKIIEQQQEQLSKQAAQIEAMQQKIGGVAASVEQKADKEELAELEKSNTSSIINSKLDGVDVSLYGQINRAGVFVDNGDKSKTYFADNSYSSTRMGLNVKADVNEDFGIGGKIEYEFRSSRSATINQLDTTGDNELYLRHADLFFDSKTYGKLSLGQGSMAADGTSGVDLSGTTVIAAVAVNDMAGGHYWYDGSTAISAGGLQISNVFGDLDGGREDRVRYDSPSFNGFMASASAGTDDMFDIALRYNRKYDGVTVASAVAWQQPDSDVIDNRFNGSVSVLWDNGFNVTLAGGADDSDAANEASFWYGKVGYRASLFEMGKTSFSFDYGQFDEYNDKGKLDAAIAATGDADTWSLAVVQDIQDWGTELYLGFRQYQYENDAVDYDDINVLMSGARIKF